VIGKTNISSSGTTTNLYAYNLGNKLSSVASGATVLASYQYNDQGTRVRKTEGSTKFYLIDANNHTGYEQVLEELDAVGGTPSTSYVLGDDVLGQCGATTSDPRWMLYDGHGNTRQLANKNANATSHYSYEAYGATVGTSTTSAETSMLYSGEQYDSTLKMYNLRARFYDPSNGRFNARDAFAGNNSDPQTLHKYLYANCDPVNGTDPSGNFTLIETSITVAIIAVIAAFVAAAISVTADLVEGKATAVEIWSNALMAFGTTLVSFLCLPIAIIILIVGIIQIVRQVFSKEGLHLSERDKWEMIAYLCLALIVSITIRNPAIASKIATQRMVAAGTVEKLAGDYAAVTKAQTGGETPSVTAAVDPMDPDTVFLGHGGDPQPAGGYHPDLEVKMREAKLLNADDPNVKWDPSNCSEAKAADAALKAGKDLKKMIFHTARPRTGKPLPMCPHCRYILSGATVTSERPPK